MSSETPSATQSTCSSPRCSRFSQTTGVERSPSPMTDISFDDDDDKVVVDDDSMPDPLSAILPGSWLRWPRQILWVIIQRILFKSLASFLIVLFLQSIEHVFLWMIGGHTSVSPIPPSDESHHFAPPPHKHSRSPCPALNMLANHGYLPRDGQNISTQQMIHGLQEGFWLSYPLAWLITHGGYLLCGQFKMMSLYDLRRHNGVEHNASLVHVDTWFGYEYAPARYDKELYNALEADSHDGQTLTINDFARARNRREEESGALDATHAEIARGEVALVLDIFGQEDRRIGIDTLHQLWCEERFPRGFKPTHQQTLARSILTAQGVKQRMISERTGEPLRENWIQKAVKIYMILKGTPPNDAPCHMHGCPRAWRKSV